MLVVTGAVLLLLGLAAGAVLLCVPPGWIAAQPGYLTWAAFPLFSALGYLLLIAATDTRVAAMVTRFTAVVTVLLALAAALVLFAADNGWLAMAGGSWPLWYVMLIGLPAGVSGLAVGQRIARSAAS